MVFRNTFFRQIACSTQKEDSNRQQYGHSQPFEEENHALEAPNFKGLADEDENVFAPCEFCKESFPISQLKIHEVEIENESFDNAQFTQQLDSFVFRLAASFRN